jgi:cell division protease FtsH
MVTQWGLSKKLGPMLFAKEEGEVFLGRTSANSLHMSEETAKLIDQEIKDVINRNYQRSEHLIKENIDILHAMKDALMKYETIDALQIDDLMARTTVRPPADWDDKDSSSSDSDKSNGKAAEETDTTSKDTAQASQDEPDTSKPNGDTPAS